MERSISLPIAFAHKSLAIFFFNQDVAAYIKKEFDRKYNATWWVFPLFVVITSAMHSRDPATNLHPFAVLELISDFLRTSLQACYRWTKLWFLCHPWNQAFHLLLSRTSRYFIVQERIDQIVRLCDWERINNRKGENGVTLWLNMVVERNACW